MCGSGWCVHICVVSSCSAHTMDTVGNGPAAAETRQSRSGFGGVGGNGIQTQPEKRAEAKKTRRRTQPRRAADRHQISARLTHPVAVPLPPFLTLPGRDPTILFLHRAAFAALLCSASPRRPRLPSTVETEGNKRDKQTSKKDLASINRGSGSWIRRALTSRRRRGLRARSVAAPPGDGAGASTRSLCCFLGGASCVSSHGLAHRRRRLVSPSS